MTPSSFPHVRLTPKAEARAIRHGFPWVYANELVLDRRTRAIAPGALAMLEDSERRPLGVVAVNRAVEDHLPDARPRPRGGDRSGLVRGAACAGAGASGAALCRALSIA